MVISSGFASVIIALVGYTAVAFESRYMLAWFTICLVVLFIIESIVGLLSYVYQDNLEDDLKDNLKSFFIYPYGLNFDSTLTVDNIQQKYYCCGADSFQDWETSVWRTQHPGHHTPDSCCKTPTPGCGVRDHPSNIHYTGCRHRLFDQVTEQLVYVSCVSVGIAVLQICGIIITSSLFSTLHKNDKYSNCNHDEVKQWIEK